MQPFKDLVGEIHRRSLWQVLGIYAAASWGALQVVDTLVESAGLPEWFPGFAFALLVLGLPMVLATAFVQEGMGSRGSARAPEEGAEAAPAPEETSPVNLAAGTGSLDRPSTRPPLLNRTLTWRNAAMGGVFAFALWGVLAAAWVLLLGAPIATADASEGPSLQSVAVLPFDVRGGDDDDGFADGIHDDILTQLSKISALKVISRTSVMTYRDTEKSMPEIGLELGVATLIEGGIQRSGSQVRINLQLIDAQTDEHLWAETYNRDLLDIFAVQADIAERVAEALQAVITPEEASRLGQKETDSEAALELMLQSWALANARRSADNEAALALAIRARELDPTYASAFAGVGNAYLVRAVFHGFPREWYDSALVAFDQSIALDPDGGGHHGRGVTLAFSGRITEAKSAFSRALEISPGNAAAMADMAMTVDGLRGDLQEGLYWATKATTLDPLNSYAWNSLALMEMMMGRMARAEEAWRQGFHDESPDEQWLSTGSAIALFNGDVPEATRRLEDFRSAVGEGNQTLIVDYLLLVEAGRFEEALVVAQRLATEYPEGFDPIMGPSVLTLARALFLAGDVERARATAAAVLPALQAISAGEGFLGPAWMMTAYAIMGDHTSATDALRQAHEGGMLGTWYHQRDAVLAAFNATPGAQAIYAQMDRAMEQQRLLADARVATLGR